MTDTTDQIIHAVLQKHPVVLFMKGTPEEPYCGFSHQVSKLLLGMKVDFYSVNVMQDQAIREGIKTFSKWPTIPQLYINQSFIGGCDIILEMHAAGELKPLLEMYTS